MIATLTEARSGLRIERATIGEYDALARFHYRAARPANPVLILGAFDGDACAGVLCVSMPVLNGPWRSRLWAGAMGEGMDARGAAALVNERVRTISRVIVEPRYRGRGVGVALVREYLRAPLTRLTEALVAAGSWSPIFERAGMRAVEIAPARRDVRLARRLGELEIPAWTLIEVGCAANRMKRRAVREAVERWARDGKGTRRLIGARPGWELAVRAASSVLSRRVAYGFDVAGVRVGKEELTQIGPDGPR